MNVSLAHLVHLDDRKVTSTGKLVGCEMAMNRIQFQHGLSMPKFLKGYITEVLCEQALEADRWPNGLCSPRCGQTANYILCGHIFEKNLKRVTLKLWKDIKSRDTSLRS